MGVALPRQCCGPGMAPWHERSPDITPWHRPGPSCSFTVPLRDNKVPEPYPEQHPWECPWAVSLGQAAVAEVLFLPEGVALLSARDTVTLPACACAHPVTSQVQPHRAGPLGEGTEVSGGQSFVGHGQCVGTAGVTALARVGSTEQRAVVTALVVALTRCQPRWVPHHCALPQVCSVLRSPPSTCPRRPPCAGTRQRQRRDSRGRA